MIKMDWIAVIAIISGIILLIIGIALIFNLSLLMQLVEEILGALCVILGVVALIFGSKLLKSV